MIFLIPIIKRGMWVVVRNKKDSTQNRHIPKKQEVPPFEESNVIRSYMLLTQLFVSLYNHV